MSANALIKTIHDTSILVSVSCRVWSARKLDRKQTADLNSSKNATADASRVNKYLMADSDELLRDIQRIGRRARDTLENASVPWDDRGYRMISNLGSIEFLRELAPIETEFNDKVDAFCQAYPELRENALRALGDMAIADDYPPVEAIRQKFALDSVLMPIAPGFSDSRTGLTDAQAEAMGKHYEAIVQERYETALVAAWDRLRDNVRHMVDRLAIEEGKTKVFHASMVDNIRETVGLLASLNLFNTPQLAQLQLQIEVELCANDAVALRNSMSAAAQVRSSAMAILTRLPLGNSFASPPLAISPSLASAPHPESYVVAIPSVLPLSNTVESGCTTSPAHPVSKTSTGTPNSIAPVGGTFSTNSPSLPPLPSVFGKGE